MDAVVIYPFEARFTNGKVTTRKSKTLPLVYRGNPYFLKIGNIFVRRQGTRYVDVGNVLENNRLPVVWIYERLPNPIYDQLDKDELTPDELNVLKEMNKDPDQDYRMGDFIALSKNTKFNPQQDNVYTFGDGVWGRVDNFPEINPVTSTDEMNVPQASYILYKITDSAPFDQETYTLEEFEGILGEQLSKFLPENSYYAILDGADEAAPNAMYRLVESTFEDESEIPTTKIVWVTYDMGVLNHVRQDELGDHDLPLFQPGDYVSGIDAIGQMFTWSVEEEGARFLDGFDTQELEMGRLTAPPITGRRRQSRTRSPTPVRSPSPQRRSPSRSPSPQRRSPSRSPSPQRRGERLTQAQIDQLLDTLKYDKRMKVNGQNSYVMRGDLLNVRRGYIIVDYLAQPEFRNRDRMYKVPNSEVERLKTGLRAALADGSYTISSSSDNYFDQEMDHIKYLRF